MPDTGQSVSSVSQGASVRNSYAASSCSRAILLALTVGAGVTTPTGALAIQAQFSLTYGLARMLLTGDLGPDSYTDAALADPEVQRLERLIDVRTRG